jgi:hypothetical protein
MNFERYLEVQILWSNKTFGKGKRTEGICQHIEKELKEIRSSPTDLTEWIDVVILALDGAWRAGFSPFEICRELVKKQNINIERKWPPIGPEDIVNEHIKDNPEPTPH